MEIMGITVGRRASGCDAGVMTSYQAPPADGLEAQWVNAHDQVMETVSLRWENEAWTVESQLVEPQAQAVMRVSAGWQCRQVLLFRDLPEPDLWLATDGAGRWGEVNGAHRDDLDGCTEMLVSGSVIGHVVPIRRLPLLVGHAADIRIALIDPDTLAVAAVSRRYHRVGEQRWEIEDLTRSRERSSESSRLILDVDRHGVPLDAGTHRRRVM
jgi:hypothetical protein